MLSVLAGASWSIVPPACVTGAPNGDASPPARPPTLNVESPQPGQSFELTEVLVDVPVVVTTTDFALVPLGQEADDRRRGQVRVFVDGNDCNDPGDPDKGEPPVPYNRILPNDDGESSVGLDYCVGGLAAIDGTSHVLRAELWHGDAPLGVVKELAFRTTFRRSDAGADAAAGP